MGMTDPANANYDIGTDPWLAHPVEYGEQLVTKIDEVHALKNAHHIGYRCRLRKEQSLKRTHKVP